jgi:four helix bundle protein
VARNKHFVPHVGYIRKEIQERAFRFACDIVNFSQVRINTTLVQRRLTVQLLDAGTSLGANLEEAVAGQMKPDFIAKVFIALKEANEARFWMASRVMLHFFIFHFSFDVSTLPPVQLLPQRVVVAAADRPDEAQRAVGTRDHHLVAQAERESGLAVEGDEHLVFA